MIYSKVINSFKVREHMQQFYDFQSIYTHPPFVYKGTPNKLAVTCQHNYAQDSKGSIRLQSIHQNKIKSNSRQIKFFKLKLVKLKKKHIHQKPILL
ncbi:hypothetical protein pb186bvf_017980 [Paramecium bursaria]